MDKEIKEKLNRTSKELEKTPPIDLQEDSEKKELLSVLYDVLMQDCADWSNQKDPYKAHSGAISSYAEGLRILAKHGLFEIEWEYGRTVIGRFKEWRE